MRSKYPTPRLASRARFEGARRHGAWLVGPYAALLGSIEFPAWKGLVSYAGAFPHDVGALLGQLLVEDRGKENSKAIVPFAAPLLKADDITRFDDRVQKFFEARAIDEVLQRVPGWAKIGAAGNRGHERQGRKQDYFVGLQIGIGQFARG